MIPTSKQFVRHRLLYLLFLLLIIILGLCSRKFSKSLPSFLAAYSGDTLYALMVFCWIGLIKPAWPSLRIGLVALGFSYFIEITQLYHAPWIDSLRNNRIGGLILGYGFLWSDIVCY